MHMKMYPMLYKVLCFSIANVSTEWCGVNGLMYAKLPREAKAILALLQHDDLRFHSAEIFDGHHV